MSASTWTGDRVEALKLGWGAGKTNSEIAKALGGVTRVAVGAKINRLGLKRGDVAASEAQRMSGSARFRAHGRCRLRAARQSSRAPKSRPRSAAYA